MKGIIFSEFIEMVEQKYGVVTVQSIIDQCELESKGIYTSIGTYDHKELFDLIHVLEKTKNVHKDSILEEYGMFFFKVLEKGYAQFLENHSLFSFLESVDNYIHPEVLKLYPDAELPSFSSTIENKRLMVLTYQSSRKMSRFAIGLLRGASIFYNEPIDATILSTEKDGAEVVIEIKMR